MGNVDVVATTYVLSANLDLMTRYRLELGAWLVEHSPHSARRRSEILLVFAELLANAIEASDAESTVSITWSRAKGATTLRFVNSNPNASSIELRSMPEPGAESGRGVAIAQLHSSRLQIHAVGETVDISAVFEDRK